MVNQLNQKGTTFALSSPLEVQLKLYKILSGIESLIRKLKSIFSFSKIMQGTLLNNDSVF